MIIQISICYNSNNIIISFIFNMINFSIKKMKLIDELILFIFFHFDIFDRDVEFNDELR